MKLNRLYAPVMALLFSLIPLTLCASSEEQQLLLLIEYVAVDYGAAVEDGAIVNEAEYTEMQEFSSQIRQMAMQLVDSPSKPALIQSSGELEKAVKLKQSPAEIKSLSAQLIEMLINDYGVLKVPLKVPDLTRGKEIYQNQCASCHGMSGKGDGTLTENLDPSPTDFTDITRYNERTLSGLFNTITLGVSGTGMANFAHLPQEDRWSLAFYVGSIAVEGMQEPADFNITDIKSLVTITPATAQLRWGKDGGIEMAWLRHHPSVLYHSKLSPLEYSNRKLGEALEAYKAGNRQLAYKLSLEAYLEGFELVEPAMRALDPDFALQVERSMASLRTVLQTDGDTNDIEMQITNLQEQLQVAGDLLSGKGLSPATAFTSALVILLREGVEAMLVVLALVTFLRRTDRKEGVKYIHLGWTSALVAGALTWWVSSSLIHISGASREVTEGIAALVSSAILLYVGFWMHNKSNGSNWQYFIEREASKAVSSGALWGLTGLAFIAVYREVFETILFYQALWSQTSSAGKQSVLYGFGSGALLLVAAGIAISIYSARLPIRQFFMLSGILMFGLAFVLAGKGVGALQEAGWIGAHPVNFVSIDFLGIHPYLESLALQGLILFIGAGYWLFTRRSDHSG